MEEHEMYEPEWPKNKKIDKTVEKAFCMQAHDKHKMFSFVVCSKSVDSKGDNNYGR